MLSAVDRGHGTGAAGGCWPCVWTPGLPGAGAAAPPVALLFLVGDAAPWACGWVEAPRGSHWAAASHQVPWICLQDIFCASDLN